MNTATQMFPAIGNIVTVKFEDLTIYCQVLDMKNVYGEDRFFIEPLCGTHRQWVSMKRIIKNLGSNCKKISQPSFLTVRREVDNEGYYLPDEQLIR